MNFASRDRYRKAVEAFARRARKSELAVARATQQCALAATGEDYRRHVGYYLIDDGRTQLAATLDCSRCAQGFEPSSRAATAIYLAGLAGFALPLWLGLGFFLVLNNTAGWLTALTMTLAAAPLAGLANALLQGLITHSLAPRRLSKLDFSEGIPEAFKSAVVVPAIFGGVEDIDPLLDRIELNYLNNDDRNLVYVLLGDFADASTRERSDDEAIVDAIRTRLNALNQRRARTGDAHGPFVALHRRREWNAAQNCWMGWERKRGKLLAFNRLILGDDRHRFETIAGDDRALAGIRYVITLDADTGMPPGAARVLAGTMAHPLNHAVVDTASGRVSRGYAFLQPRLDTDPVTTVHNRFTRIFAGDTTVDLYAHAVSDAYQDLFGEGIFVGKGLYDPRVVDYVLGQRIPENALLSHDLLEGSFGRTALVTDTCFYENFPPNLLTFFHRSHRWIRGDWQLLPWLTRRMRLADGSQERNPLSGIQRWRIIDNLRRSLMAPCLVALFCIGWSDALPGPAWVWTLLILAVAAEPIWADLLALAWRSTADWRQAPRHARETPVWLHQRLRRWLLTVSLLPYESRVVLDAIGRTLYRLMASRQNLLEWRSAHHVQRALGDGFVPAAIAREMWISPACALAIGALLLVFFPYALWPAAPLLLAWLLAPALVYGISRPLSENTPRLSPSEQQALRDVARKTWFFFERFMGPDDHWLPPDNYQEEPRVVLARRTSPTNIGMGLLATLSAFDLGYIDLLSLLARLNSSFEQIKLLERYRGHWLNWYETSDLRSMPPRYVSTVDSGNLAASLMTLSRGLEQLRHQPIVASQLLVGVCDTLIVLESLSKPAAARQLSAAGERWAVAIRDCRSAIAERAADDGWTLLDRLADEYLPALQTRLLAVVDAAEPAFSVERLTQLQQWLEELRRQATHARESGNRLLPWRRLVQDPPDLYRDEGTRDPHAGKHWDEICHTLSQPVTLENCAESAAAARASLEQVDAALDALGCADETRTQARAWHKQLRDALQAGEQAANAQLSELQQLITQADAWVAAMDFGFLYDRARHLFRIGYNVDDARVDSNYYDLLASEARLTGFVAIAKGDVPSQHWLHLARPFSRVHGQVVLMSWGATLFEYLMPVLLMTTPPGSLMGRACRSAIKVQTDFVASKRLPWGISESGYYQLDSQANYQYRAFGVPGLGFRRDLGDQLVVSPYSSIMALPFAPDAVVENLRMLEQLGAMGQYGFYEAIDYGRSDLEGPRRAHIVRSYMSHHQGMALLALNNFVNSEIMPQRFNSDTRVARLATLLHEQPPVSPPAMRPWAGAQPAHTFRAAMPLVSWQPARGHMLREYNLLSNGVLSSLQGADGSGGSQWQGIALTRWSADGTRDTQGHWCYVKDLQDNAVTSVGFEPSTGDSDTTRTLFAPHQVEYQRRALALFCHLRIGLSSQHDVEVRQLVIKNESGRRRQLLIGTYAEVVLAPPADDLRHPAFVKLFVETRYLAESQTLLYRRRPRGADEKPVYLAHTLRVSPETSHSVRWETDREHFLGRGGSPSAPQALAASTSGLSGFGNTSGTVLDPVLATGVELELAPYAATTITYITGVGRVRQEVLDAVRAYHAPSRAQWVFEQARMQSEQLLGDLGIEPWAVEWMMTLLSALMVPIPALRAPSNLLARSARIQDSLWGRGISGDHPILLVRIHSVGDAAFARQLLQAHAFWNVRGQPVDLVLTDESPGGYVQPVRDRLQQLIAEVQSDTPRVIVGDVRVLSGPELSEHDRVQLWSAAQVILDASAGTIAHQLNPARTHAAALPPFVAVGSGIGTRPATQALMRPNDLEFDNGFGGFADNGREYVIHLEAGQRPPAPWSNVIANPGFGCLVTDAGLGCTWAGNSGENRLTPWTNDPVRDPPSEVLYLRDEETAQVWSPTPGPRPTDGAYQIRHGAGYTLYRHHCHGLEQMLRVSVEREQPVKLVRLSLTNHWPWTRRITATYYAEWVLGTSRAQTAAHIVTEYESDSGVMLARNAFTRDSQPGVAFLTASQRAHGVTSDRSEFLGSSGGVDAPAAMFRIGLSGRVESGRDSCAAYQIHVNLPPNARCEFYFVLGQGRDRETALALARQFSNPEAAARAESSLAEFWDDHLARLQIHTPDRATDLMVNRWLPYQLLSCRYWGRSGYYQSSGAFGFRDQLQDVLALLWTRPEWTRAYILKSASRQFPEGDVLHWWHEQPLRGVRTRCSDDLLWLPYATAQYVAATGDDTILDQNVLYLDGEPLADDEAERYTEYAEGSLEGTLYEHCWHAIERAAQMGVHGLPLIGDGDWNDGYNRIGVGGQGESVWLAWFVIRVCRDFAPLCTRRGDTSRARRYAELATTVERQVEATAWDGAWYRRAYFDDGTPLGSADNDECQIDLMAQTWAVLARDEFSEMSRARAVQAMASVDARLVEGEARLIRLLDPPFDRSEMEPGYIKGYPPGIRENGGQYTHGAAWIVWAAAALGDGDRAWHLFSLLNPIHRAADADSAARYRVEPYVLAGDIYGVDPHIGRGGWTWYTGSAGWLFRGALEALLGLKRRGAVLEIDPCLPAAWHGFSVSLRHGDSRYEIEVEISPSAFSKAPCVMVDDELIADTRLPLIDDGTSHRVVISVCRPPTTHA
jgi:cyclic beta-1,2-glucan synthetase